MTKDGDSTLKVAYQIDLTLFLSIHQIYLQKGTGQMSSRVSHRDDYPSNNNQNNTIDFTLPLVSKIEEVRIQTLEDIISLLCQLANDLMKILDSETIQLNDKLITPKHIVSLKEASNQLKYHEKISPNSSGKGLSNISADVDQTIQLLTKMKIRDSDSGLPKVRKLDDFGGSPLIGQLSTITQKESEENLLHNYLRKNVSQKRRSKMNLGKNAFLSGISSIEDLEFEVIRQETRKSLDNPYHKNNQNRKGLYNDLQKIKGQDSLLPSVKSYLDKHRKNIGQAGKLPQYQIQKLI